jgi:N6-adenosine-specific RNA methylase IME4
MITRNFLGLRRKVMSFCVWNAKALPIRNESVDLVITDAPWPFKRRIGKSKAVRATDYPLLSLTEILECFLEIKRVLKPGGCVYVFVPAQIMPSFFDMARLTGLEYRQQLIWDKMRLGLGHYWRNKMENIIMLSKGKPNRMTSIRHIGNILQAKASRGSYKPPALYITLISAHGQDGIKQVVLDPFAGSDPLSVAESGLPVLAVSGDLVIPSER